MYVCTDALGMIPFKGSELQVDANHSSLIPSSMLLKSSGFSAHAPAQYFPHFLSQFAEQLELGRSLGLNVEQRVLCEVEAIGVGIEVDDCAEFPFDTDP